MICQNDFSMNREFNSDQSNPIAPEVENSRFKWTPSRKNKIFICVLKRALAIESEIQQEKNAQFFKGVAAELGTTPQKCREFLRLWSKKKVATNWPMGKANELLKIVFKESSLEKGYKAASMIYGMTDDICQKCVEDCQAEFIKQTLFKKTRKKINNIQSVIDLTSSIISSSSVSSASSSSVSSTSSSSVSSTSSSSVSSSSAQLEPQVREYKKNFEDLGRKWLSDHDDALKQMFDEIKDKTNKNYKKVAKKLNELFGTNRSENAVKKRCFRFKHGVRKIKGRIEWTQKKRKQLRSHVWIYVKNNSNQLKQKFFCNAGEDMGVTPNGIERKLQRWFSETEEQLLKTKWSKEQETLLIETVNAASTLEEGISAAVKKFKIDDAHLLVRFDDILIRRFFYMGIVNKTDERIRNSTSNEQKNISLPIQLENNSIQIEQENIFPQIQQENIPLQQENIPLQQENIPQIQQESKSTQTRKKIVKRKAPTQIVNKVKRIKKPIIKMEEGTADVIESLCGLGKVTS